MPIVYPIAAASFFLTYVLDKFLILRFYRTPPEYNARFSYWFVNGLFIGLIIHLGFSIWSYSVPGIFFFPDAATSQEISLNLGSLEFQTGINVDVLQRITAPHTLPLLVTFFVLIAHYTLFNFVLGIFGIKVKPKRKRGKKSNRDAEELLPALQEAQQSKYLRGLKSYNILQNPEYARAFGIPKSFANRHREVNEVRELPGGEVVPELPEKIRARYN